jgi:beta-lactamase regulating signal transducer with metallopeptidase domain
MFAMRGMAVSFSIFALVYGALSVAVWGLWRQVWRVGQRHSARSCADRLFLLRLIPLAAAGGITLGLAVPSFLLLEPRAMNEPMGTALLLLGFCGLTVILAGMWNAAAAWVRVRQAIAQWSDAGLAAVASPMDSGDSIPVRRISGAAPPVWTAGILRSSVWLSQAAEVALTEGELEAALRHEIAHARRRDNLRKLVLRLVPFPGMAELERAWGEATEMAADDAAVSSASEALDLAAAMIKLSRPTPMEPPMELTTALLRSPAESVNARVRRLVAWADRRESSAPKYSWGYALCAAAAVAITLGVTYSALLMQVHAATEWLVR